MPSDRTQQIILDAEQALLHSIQSSTSARVDIAFAGQPCDLDGIPGDAHLRMQAERLHFPRPIMKVLVDVDQGSKKKQVFLHFRVQAWVRTVVVARSVRSGEVFGIGDCTEQEVDVALSGQTLARSSPANARWIALRPMGAGTPLSPGAIARVL